MFISHHAFIKCTERKENSFSPYVVTSSEVFVSLITGSMKLTFHLNEAENFFPVSLAFLFRRNSLRSRVQPIISNYHFFVKPEQLHEFLFLLCE